MLASAVAGRGGGSLWIRQAFPGAVGRRGALLLGAGPGRSGLLRRSVYIRWWALPLFQAGGRLALGVTPASADPRVTGNLFLFSEEVVSDDFGLFVPREKATRTNTNRAGNIAGLGRKEHRLRLNAKRIPPGDLQIG